VDEALLLHREEEREVPALRHRAEPALPVLNAFLPAHCGDLLRLLMPALLIVVPDHVLQHRDRAGHVGDPVSLAQGRQAALKIVKPLLDLARIWYENVGCTLLMMGCGQVAAVLW
jgi:hypothetical protein